MWTLQQSACAVKYDGLYDGLLSTIYVRLTLHIFRGIMQGSATDAGRPANPVVGGSVMRKLLSFIIAAVLASAFTVTPATAAPKKAPVAKAQKVGQFSAGRCREAVRAAGIRSGPEGLAALRRCIAKGPGAI